MATEAQAQDLRRGVGYKYDDETSLPQVEADLIFSKFTYDTDARNLASAVVYYLEGLYVDAAKMATYKQNLSTHNVSDIFNHLERVLKYWNDKLLKAELDEEFELGSVRFGKPKQIPTRWKEYPDS